LVELFLALGLDPRIDQHHEDDYLCEQDNILDDDGLILSGLEGAPEIILIGGHLNYSCSGFV
jgi:hypothetical protein